MDRGDRWLVAALAGTVVGAALALHGLLAPAGSGPPREQLGRAPSPGVRWRLDRASESGTVVALTGGVAVEALTGSSGSGPVLEARDLTTGTRRWRTPLLPGVLVRAGGVLVAYRPAAVEWMGPGPALAAYDLATGRRLWQRDAPDDRAMVLLAGGPDDDFAVLDDARPGRQGELSLRDARTGQRRWTAPLPAGCTSTDPSSPQPGTAAVTRWILVAARCSGRTVVLQFPVAGGAPVRSVALPGPVARIRSQDGDPAVVETGDATRTLIDQGSATARPAGPSLEGPPARVVSVCGSHVLLRPDGAQLVVADSADLAPRWRTAPVTLVADPACTADRLVTVDQDPRDDRARRLVTYALADGTATVTPLVTPVGGATQFGVRAVDGATAVTARSPGSGETLWLVGPPGA